MSPPSRWALFKNCLSTGALLHWDLTKMTLTNPPSAWLNFRPFFFLTINQPPHLPILRAFTLENLWLSILSLTLFRCNSSPSLFPVLQPRNDFLKDLGDIRWYVECRILTFSSHRWLNHIEQPPRSCPPLLFHWLTPVLSYLSFQWSLVQSLSSTAAVLKKAFFAQKALFNTIFLWQFTWIRASQSCGMGMKDVTHESGIWWNIDPLSTQGSYTEPVYPEPQCKDPLPFTYIHL